MLYRIFKHSHLRSVERRAPDGEVLSEVLLLTLPSHLILQRRCGMMFDSRSCELLRDLGRFHHDLTVLPYPGNSGFYQEIIPVYGLNAGVQGFSCNVAYELLNHS